MLASQDTRDLGFACADLLGKPCLVLLVGLEPRRHCDRPFSSHRHFDSFSEFAVGIPAHSYRGSHAKSIRCAKQLDQKVTSRVTICVVIGERIRAWRQIRGVTQEELGNRIGRTGATVSRIESGDQSAKQDVVEAIAKALSLTMAEFYGAVPSAPPETAKAS